MFNPVHNGHLRIAIECKEAFSFDQLRMFPCAEPPHRQQPSVSAQHRFKMLQLALENVKGILADGREMESAGPSYTINTLRSLRAEFPQSKFYLIIGSDAFQSFSAWHEWQKILQLSNIVIAQRPDSRDDRSSDMGKLLARCFTENLNSFLAVSHGQIYCFKVSQLEISSSQIRKMFKQHKSAQFLMPENVLDYIKSNRIYP